MEELELKKVELPFGKVIYQYKKGQRITEDTGILVDSVLNIHGSEKCRVLDMGSGTGIVAIMLSYYRPEWQITGIEIQEQLVELAERNNEEAGTNANFLHADLRVLSKEWFDSFGLVVSNPPYFPYDKGKVSENHERAISRIELTCSMKSVVSAVSSYLSSDGSAYIMYPSDRREEMQKEAAVNEMMVVSETELGNRNKKIVFRMKKR
ncbi:MAG: methyltransferase domain-containing protein [Candidatus Cloacimonetes bacterium]|nr:methyltransferase domain-containing protein [Candidatus Cloacimonadota bacterium]